MIYPWGNFSVIDFVEFHTSSIYQEPSVNPHFYINEAESVVDSLENKIFINFLTLVTA